MVVAALKTLAAGINMLGTQLKLKTLSLWTRSEAYRPYAGLLKVVAATETLAAGINMPARTTIIGSLSRRQSSGHALLKHNQLLQMAGRAGRRGFDTAGACSTYAGAYAHSLYRSCRSRRIDSLQGACTQFSAADLNRRDLGTSSRTMVAM